MQIQIISVSPAAWKEGKVNAQTGKASKYQEVVLTYTAGGKTSTKKVMSFAPIFNAVKEAEGGEQYDVEMIKEGEYWNWKAMSKMAAGATTTSVDAPPKAQMTRPSTYETAEERAKKQVYIIRQSSLANAISLLAANGGKKNSTEEVVAVAEQFVAFVLGETAPSVFDLEDDIPV